MIARSLDGRGYWLLVASLAFAVGVVAVVLFNVAVVPELRQGGAIAALVNPSPSPTPTPAATPEPTPLSPMSPSGLAIPPDSNCAGCHMTTTGVIDTKPIPLMGHPLEGWKDCTACHAPGRLVETAEGHSGLHKEDCLVCHQVRPAESSAEPRPHHVYTDQSCISCHGVKAPLPTDMEGRHDCWICHAGTEFEDLFGGPAAAASPNP